MRYISRVLLAGVACAVLAAETPSVIAIRNARIVTAAGPVIESGTVVIRDGLIEAVGEKASPPPDAWVLEGANLTVYPGLMDPLSRWGLPAPPAETPRAAPQGRPPATPPSTPVRGPEDRPSNTSWLNAADLIDPAEKSIPAARDAGFTTAAAYPATGIFAGQGAVFNLAGERAGDMVVSVPAGLYLTMSTAGFTNFPGSLMGVIAYIRQVYLDAEHYQTAKAQYASNPRGMRRPAHDRSLEGVLQAPRILLPAATAVDIDRMLRLAAELKRPAILYGAHEAYRSADQLKRAGVPVLVSLKWPERDRDADPDTEEPLRVLELRKQAPSTPAVLARAGVTFAFYSDGIERPADLRKAVKRAIDAGLAAQDAVRALTLSAAQIYGLADRLGSVEKGKIANLVVADGDLFSERTRIKYVIVDGRKFEPAPPPPEAETRSKEVLR